MRASLTLTLAVVVGCAGATPAPAIAPSASSPACVDPAFRAFDFWIGAWDVTVKAPATPGAPWASARGTQRVEAILGGCAIAEHFAADGPGPAWAGTSLSVWQPALGQWRQTWVDDQGGYLAFTGGIEDGAMTLYGEPRAQQGVMTRKRMRFERVTADALHWVWQQTTDDGATWQDLMTIDYVRAANQTGTHSR
ncbi:MAG: DUF1579 domain-containing protein [Deltaproteobacteria bacterium]|nr:DUF1579 domain-containing protein [Deltaproteobacteria bacterium]